MFLDEDMHDFVVFQLVADGANGGSNKTIGLLCLPVFEIIDKQSKSLWFSLKDVRGEIVFDDTYQGNPLVNALCVGVMCVIGLGWRLPRSLFGRRGGLVQAAFRWVLVCPRPNTQLCVCVCVRVNS